MSRAGSMVAAMILAGGLFAGCTSRSGGEPRPAPGASIVSPEPTRPRELRLDGKDPCALIPRADYERFYLKRPGERGQNKSYKSPECNYGTIFGGFRIVFVVTEGIEKWTDGSRIAKADPVAPVSGFPALSIMITADRFACEVAVDVAEGQYLLVLARVTSSMVSQVPEQCEFAHQFAESAMKALVAS